MPRFEVSYLKANDPITKRALWIREQRMQDRVWRWCVLTDPSRTTPLLCKEGPGEVESSTPPSPPLQRGGVGGASWSFTWDDPSESFRLMPSWMYWLPLPTKYESPHWNGRISGELVIENDCWQLAHWPAQQGHLWGWRISREWAWAHGNCFMEDHTAAFEILTSGGRTLLNLRSQQFNLTANSLRIWRCTRHETSPSHWNWEFAHDDLRIAGHFQLGYASMVEIDYPTPQGGTRTCHNTKVGFGSIAVSRAGRPVLQLTAHDSLAWEYVG